MRKTVPSKPSHALGIERAFVVLLALVLLCASLGMDALAAGPTVSIVPAHSQVSRGEAFTVTAWISDAVDLAGYGFSMDFDPQVLTVTSVTDAGFLPPGFLVELDDIDPAGTATFGAFLVPAPEQGTDGDGALARITLEATGAGISALDLHDVTLFDTASVPQIPEAQDGMVTARGHLFLPLVARDYISP